MSQIPNKSNPEKTKKVKEGFFTGNASISGIYGVKKDWIYIRVKLYREKDSDKWYSEKYYKIEFWFNFLLLKLFYCKKFLIF